MYLTMRPVICCVVFCLALLELSSAQQPGYGACPSVRIMDNFQLESYLGKWYEIERFFSFFQNGICAEANYGPVDNRGRVKVVNKEVSNNRIVGISGSAFSAARDGEARLKVQFNIPIEGTQTSDYWVLGTDYETYAVVWACRDIAGLFKFESAWILGRSRELPQQAWSDIEAIITQNGINRSYFIKANQHDCSNIDGEPWSSPFSGLGK